MYKVKGLRAARPLSYLAIEGIAKAEELWVRSPDHHQDDQRHPHTASQALVGLRTHGEVTAHRGPIGASQQNPIPFMGIG